MYLGSTVLKQMKRGILLLCTLAFISACVSQLNNVHQVQLDDNITYVLQPIPEELINTGILASFSVNQQGKEEQLLMQVEMSPSRLLISGMTVEGLSLFSLDWHTSLGTLNIDKKIVIEPLRILAELQLALWPSTSISQGLAQGQLHVKENKREITAAGEVIYQITVNENNSELINLKQNYTIAVDEIERWLLTTEQGKLETKP
ncbi:DUF3261 domain-containing protein [Colwellia sp. RSH04]|uniref:DUF3261 domain-containing protein n=1 Tax=Colwellia sp. RSH04 TaxID=2305464 RepID=UPI000E5791A1|nr:DUF3261 domain-containing protein [Colwellia sp. RSH04]RHW75798.1 DUF3261 domain-containing protein [Colwellia sp. RSH04]